MTSTSLKNTLNQPHPALISVLEWTNTPLAKQIAEMQKIMAPVTDLLRQGDKWKELASFGHDKFIRQLQEISPTSKLQKQYANLVAKTNSDLVTKANSITGRHSHILDRQHALKVFLANSTQSSQLLAELVSGRNTLNALEEKGNWQRQYEVLFNSLGRFKNPFETEALQKVLGSLDYATKVAGAGKSSEFDEEEQYADQASMAFDAIVANSSGAVTLEDQLASIVSAIENTKDSRLQRILWFIVIPAIFLLITIFVAPFADFYIKKHLENASSRQEATKIIKQEARWAVDDIRRLNNYRFVCIERGKPLFVRSAAGARSPIIGQLQFGQTVYVVQKSKDFTLVHWRSPDGSSELQGWVFSRYLKRFD